MDKRIFIDWIDDKKISTRILVILLVAIYVGAHFGRPVPWVGMAALLGSIVLPFAIFLIWVIDSDWIDRLLKRRWTAILFAGAVVIYGIFARTFSNDLLNTYFKVDPGYFPVTGIFLTTVYLLVGVFQPLVMFPISLAVVMFGGISLLVIFMLDNWCKRLKRAALLCLFAVLASASGQTLGLLQNELPQLAERVALRSDFNDNNRCTADWPARVDKVLFLNDGNVLAHLPATQSYQVLPCNPR
ncbi:hypothetical protein [Paraburkholderia agricolaris]|uniref:hypothetical protein n=1 Tax=Paraburkholderia agricolaris TaxID=2152888 RepID=UPI0012913EC2|nr:hypothetical protein [Paraburkholderia agricolaris]